MRVQPSVMAQLSRPASWERPWEAVGRPAPTDTGSRVGTTPAEAVCQPIVAAASDALGHLRPFCSKYAKEIHGMSVDQVDRPWKSIYIEWLYTPEEVPKNIGDDLPTGYFSETNVDVELVKVLPLLQRHAVALEQLCWDSEDEGSWLLPDLEDAKHQLMCLLTDVLDGIRRRRLEPPPAVDRAIMPFGCRQMRGRAGRMRDWLLLRHYANLLEYIVQVFTKLQAGVPNRFAY